MSKYIEEFEKSQIAETDYPTVTVGDTCSQGN